MDSSSVEIKDNVSAVVVKEVASVENITVVATDSTAMAVSQARLTDWCARKRDEAQQALTELEENLAIAKKSKWRTTTLTTAVRRERQRVTFYEKCGAALGAGYCIIPNFDADVFAIRTTKNAIGQSTSDWGTQRAINSLPQQVTSASDIGEGDNVSPRPIGQYLNAYKRDESKSAITTIVEAVDFGAIDFPFTLARTEILSETQRAMAMKLFDEMGALPARRRSRNGDPMVVGRIRKPWMKEWQANNHVTFLIVWWLDTAAL